MFNGIRPEPTNKRFDSAYLQINFLICRKIHSDTFLTRRNFSLLITSHHEVLEKKDFFKTKKMESDFFIRDPIAKPAKQKKQVALEKSFRLQTRGGLVAAAEVM